MSEPVLIHLNTVRPVGPFCADSPEADYFLTTLPKVFASARGVRGLYWHSHALRAPDGRYMTQSALATLRTDGTEENPQIMTIAGWRDAEALTRYIARNPQHREAMLRLRDWVDRSQGPTLVLWWAPPGCRPSPEAAWERLVRLRRDGAGPEAFTLAQRFAPDGRPALQSESSGG